MDKVEDIAEKINDGLDKEVKRIDSPKDVVTNSILSLVSDQLHKASNYDIIIQKAQDKVVDRIDNNELEFSELMEVISTMNNKKLEIINSMFDPFRGQKQGLFDNGNESSPDDFDKGIKNLSHDELQTLEAVFRGVQNLSKK